VKLGKLKNFGHSQSATEFGPEYFDKESVLNSLTLSSRFVYAAEAASDSDRNVGFEPKSNRRWLARESSQANQVQDFGPPPTDSAQDETHPVNLRVEPPLNKKPRTNIHLEPIETVRQVEAPERANRSKERKNWENLQAKLKLIRERSRSR